MIFTIPIAQSLLLRRSSPRSLPHLSRLDSNILVRCVHGSKRRTRRPTIANLIEEGEQKGIDLAESDTTVTASGWVRSVRKQKGISFLNLGDGSTAKALQVVLKGSLAER
jgi:hypothetical protein